jgi:hypothetical protein
MDVFAGEQSHFNTDCDAILFINTMCYAFFLTAKVELITNSADKCCVGAKKFALFLMVGAVTYRY